MERFWETGIKDWLETLIKIYTIMILVSFLFGFFFAMLLCVGSYKIARMIADAEDEESRLKISH